MTVIHPNSISGIASVTSQSNSLYFYESDHSTKLTINAHVAGNVTGDITATNGTFSGDVTIGGKLTYDDVTNIDSVGIITARSDVSIADKIIHTGDTNTAIRFPAADTVTVETSGSERLRIASDGKVGVGEDSPEALLHVGSADSWIDIGQQSGNRTKIGFNNNIAYYGNSSSAGQHVWKVNNTRAGSPWGSGNEVMRIDSSARLLVGRTATQNDNIAGVGYANLVQIDGAAVGEGLGVHNTDTARINICRQYAAVNGDDLGHLSFGAGFGGGSSTTTVERSRITGGAEFTNANKYGGNLQFSTCADGAASPTERMRIHSNGAITKPASPSFAARLNGSNINIATSGNTDVVFNLEYFDNGNNYNNSNGRFTAPVAGKYFFGVQLYVGFSVTAVRVMHAKFNKNGSVYAGADMFGGINADGGTHYHPTGCATMMVDLAVNDYITFNLGSLSVTGSGNATLYSSAGTRFFGYLVG